MVGSLVHHIFPTLGNDSLYNNPEVSLADTTAPQWKSLPKKVWAVWLTGYETAPVTNKVAFAVMKRRFASRGYSVNLVTLANAEELLGKETMAELHRINDNKEYLRYPQTMSDLIRL